MTAHVPTFPNGEASNKWYPADVWSLPESENTGFVSEITAVKNNEITTMTGYYKFNDRISVTGDHFHLIKRDGSWQFARSWSIKVGDSFLTESLEEEVIEKVELINEEVKVSVLSVGTEEYPNNLFFGSGILTHNFKVKLSTF